MNLINSKKIRFPISNQSLTAALIQMATHVVHIKYAWEHCHAGLT